METHWVSCLGKWMDSCLNLVTVMAALLDGQLSGFCDCADGWTAEWL